MLENFIIIIISVFVFCQGSHGRGRVKGRRSLVRCGVIMEAEEGPY